MQLKRKVKKLKKKEEPVEKIDPVIKQALQTVKKDKKVPRAVKTPQLPDMDDPRYREGGLGFVNFCNHFVRIPIYKIGDTVPTWTPMHSLPDEDWRPGVSYKRFWELQCEVAKEALQMENGLFKHRQIVLCWMRGEGKSFLAVLLQIWKHMCFVAQQIMLGANSKDQIKFVHFDIIRDLIFNSPFLLHRIGGPKQVQEKEIRRPIFDGSDERRYNIIRAISSFTGIVSNITGYTFSEIFDLSNPKFYYQLDGSIRNIPNALGVIDSTVSAKGHILHNLYEIYQNRQDDTLFFSYRYSTKGLEVDYWNPQMHQKQLDSYRVKFPPDEFARYFLNTWSSGALSMFSEDQVRCVYYKGLGQSKDFSELSHAIKKEVSLLEEVQQIENEVNVKTDHEIKHNVLEDKYKKIKDIRAQLTPMDTLYTLDPALGICTLDDLEKIGKEYETDFVLQAGFDRSDPMSLHGARSVFALLAKGCKGSRNLGFTYRDPEALEYIYFLIGLEVIDQNTLKHMKNIIIRCNNEFDDVDSICSERWGMFDFAEWCVDQGIPYEAVHPTYNTQRTFFSEFYTAVAKGNFKSPFIHIPGTRGPDILKEEMGMIVQDELAKWFGSPEKRARNGVQDDVMYAIGHAIFGGMKLTVEHFRLRYAKSSGFMFIPEKNVAGRY